MAAPTAPHTSASSGPSPHGELDFDRAPMVLTWEISQACALQCVHCRAEARPHRHPDELTTDEARAVIDRVADFEPRPPYLVFSGGDPLERPDLEELAAYAVSLGVQTAVTPASSPLLTRERLERLRDAGVVRIALSLDGATAEAHDGFRGEPGSFATIMQAATHAQELGLAVQVNSTVTRNTAGDFPRMAELVEEMGVVMWEVFFLVPVGRGAVLEALGPDETEGFLEWLAETQERVPFRIITVEAPHYRRIAHRRARARGDRGARVGSTGDGKGFVFVSHTGEIYPSGFMSLSGGNVRQDDLVEVYRDAPLFRELRDPDGFRGKCGVCEYRSICGGSRARAWAVTGHHLESDPFCAYVPRQYQRMVEAGEALPPEDYFRARRGRRLPVLPN